MIESRYHYVRLATLVSASVNALLGVVKIMVGSMSSSHALLADGIHSLSDLITDAMVLFAARFGSLAPDHDHPYGHQRIETAMTMALAVMIAVVGVGVMAQGVHHVLKGDAAYPSHLALLVAVLSVVLNEFLYHFLMRIGEKFNSNLLRANAWHNRTDAFSSMVVVIGVGGSFLGIDYSDAVAAIIVGALVVLMGGKLGWKSLRELIDTAVSPEASLLIKNIILSVPGVRAIHQLRTRYMANHIFADVHLLVSPYLSVSEGHYLGEQVRQVLLDNMDEVSDVIVHVDPEDDETHQSCLHLPNRETLVPELKARWETLSGFPSIRSVDLHYLEGLIEVTVTLPIDFIAEVGSLGELNRRYQAAVDDLKIIKAVKLKFE